ncbi:GPR1/FUN34/yaaH family-domain-containing protein [Dipodascopsis tothii]|uniref:GPR1/FUN34/yaaH family-domain-containing protein n=1 Tax=Dipodascopsis tothii TaxID=44089 RepID=UPI0034CF298A
MSTMSDNTTTRSNSAHEAFNKETADLERGLSRIERVEQAPHDPDLIKIGESYVSKRELWGAFGGTLNPGLTAPPSRKFANPAPLGLCAFALSTFLLSLINVNARGVTEPKIVVGVALFYGGFIQLCAGMWEMVLENTFGATALSSYGGFWMSYAAIELNAFGIVSAYADDTTSLNNAVGFFLIGWFIFTFLLVLCTLRSTVAFFLLFFFLDVTFLLLGIGKFYPTNIHITQAGGYFGLLTAFTAWYNAFAGMATKNNSLFVIHPVPMPQARSAAKDE